MSISDQRKREPSAGASDADRSRRTRRRINPAAIPKSALLRQLETDPRTGLTPREAGRRLGFRSAVGRDRHLFRTDTLTPLGCVKQLCREPVLWLFLAVCLSALFFGRVAMGLACLTLTLLYGTVCALCYIRVQHIEAAMQTMEAPLARVVRGGTVRRISANSLVRGDVILLYPGDVVPADARLLHADPDFRVVERELSGDPAARRAVRLTKNADVTVMPNGATLHSPENMVFAGGVIENGRARAVVVSAGMQTHLGALTGGVRPVHRSSSLPATFRRAERGLNVCNMALLVLVIPLTAIGIMTVGNRYELLDIVLAAMTPCLTSMTGHVFIRASFINASLRGSTAAEHDAACAADIRSAAALETLGQVDELILIGTAGLHDGMPHPEHLIIGESRYDCLHPGADARALRFAAYAYLYTAVLHAEETAGLSVPSEQENLLREQLSLMDALTNWSELPTDGVNLLVDSGVLLTQKNHDDPLTVRVRWKDGRTTDLCLLQSFDSIPSCTLLPDEQGFRPMTSADRESMYVSFRKMRLTGLRTCLLLSVQPEGSCLEGMIAYGPHTCRKTQGAIRALAGDGIRVTVFLRDASEENTRVLSECGITSEVPASRPEPGGQPRKEALTLRQSGTVAFESCDTSYIRDYLRARRAEGSKVCVLTGDREDRELLEAADVACTVTPGLYAACLRAVSDGDPVSWLEPGVCTSADGGHDASCASDLCRRRSDVTVRRVSREGGGILGIRRAILTVGRSQKAMAGAARFFALSQLLRVLMLIIPLCMGAALTSAPWLLVSGMLADTLVLLSLSLTDTPPTPGQTVSEPLDLRQWLTSLRADLIGIGGAVACLWVAAGIALLTAVNIGTAALDSYAGLSLLTLQLGLYLTDRTLTRRTRSGFCFLFAFLLLWVGALATTLGSGLRLYWSLILPLCGGALFFAFRLLALVLSRLFLRKSRKGGG